jgi:hypothetical protein
VQVLEIKQISGTLSFLSRAKNSGFEQVFSGNLVGNRIQKMKTGKFLIHLAHKGIFQEKTASLNPSGFLKISSFSCRKE